MPKIINIDESMKLIEELDNSQMDSAFKLGLLHASTLAVSTHIPDIVMFGEKLGDRVDDVVANYKSKNGQWGSK